MSTIEDAKRNAAKEAVAKHYPPNPKFVGIGSGTTIVYVVEAIKALGVDTSSTAFVPTGYQSNQLVVDAGLTPIAFDALPEGTVLDVAFDGADEVDDDLNCIKGGGACLFQEKLVALQAKEFVCVAGRWNFFSFVFYFLFSSFCFCCYPACQNPPSPPPQYKEYPTVQYLTTNLPQQTLENSNPVS